MPLHCFLPLSRAHRLSLPCLRLAWRLNAHRNQGNGESYGEMRHFQSLFVFTLRWLYRDAFGMRVFSLWFDCNYTAREISLLDVTIEERLLLLTHRHYMNWHYSVLGKFKETISGCYFVVFFCFAHKIKTIFLRYVWGCLCRPKPRVKLQNMR